jgi:tetratricopeptide (TPR) repeat protein
MSEQDIARARQCYELALGIAREARLDALAIDAIHMFAFLDTTPAAQLRWSQAALDVVQASSQAQAKRWEASVRNNVGYALHRLGRYDEALAQFRQAVELRERRGNAEQTRVAHWMVAWTLRSLNRIDEAMDIQLRLERENDQAGTADPHVLEELEALFRAKGDVARAEHYARRRTSLGK